MIRGSQGGEKVCFTYGKERQGMSGKVRETEIFRGEIAFLYCRSGTDCHF